VSFIENDDEFSSYSEESIEKSRYSFPQRFDHPPAWMLSEEMLLARKIAPYIKSTSGFYIEAGASNGVFQSNTLFLEYTLNWRGLLIEPNRKMYEALKDNRNNKPHIFAPYPREKNIFYNCALVGYDYEEEFVHGNFNEEDFENSLMAMVHENNPRFSEKDEELKHKKIVKVPARKLSDILDENNISKVDLLSLDVEGYELNALNGIDFDRHAPSLICVECWGSKSYRPVKNKLEDNGYILKAALTDHDFLFERRET